MAKLHLGCFDHVVPGWVNTDITPHIRISRIPMAAWLVHKLGKMTDARYQQHREKLFRNVTYLDISRRFPFGDATIECAYNSHVMEHLFPDVAEHCMREVSRVLQPGGIFRIAVPDLDAMIASYDPDDPDVFLDEFFEAKEARAKNRHHWHYNETSLCAKLKSAGFSSARRCEYQEGDLPDLGIVEHRPDSLFVEAVK
jgi:predicted SAM-dependent methyltransferase